MATESIEIQLLVDGERAATAALASVTGQVQKLNTAQKQAADSAKTQTASFAAGTQGAAKFQSTIGMASQAIGQFSGSGAKMVSMLGQTVGAMAAVSASLGPVGIAVVAITSAVSLATAAFSEMGGEVAKTKNELDDIVPSLSDVLGKMRQLNAARALERRVARGGGTSEEQEANLTRIEQSMIARGTDRDAARRAYREDPNAETQNILGKQEELYSNLRRQQRQAQRDLEAARAAEAALAVAEEQNGERESRTRNGRSSGGGRGRGGAVDQDRINELGKEAARQALEAAAKIYASELEQVARDTAEGKLAASTGRKTWGVDEGGVAKAEAQRSMDESSLAAQKQADADRYLESLAEQKTMIEDITSIVGGPMVDAFSAAADGQGDLGKLLGQAFKQTLAGLAKQEGVKGLASLAEGFAALATPGMQGSAAGFFQASGLHFAAAVAAGGVAAAIPGGGGGRGGSGGGRASGPTASGYGGSGGYEGPATIVVNWNQPAVLASTYADAGKQIQRAIREAEGRYGSG